MVRKSFEDSLNVLQWNAKSILSKRSEFIKHVSDFNFILISESWLSPNDSFIVKGFDTVRKDRDNRHGDGVTVLVKREIKYKTIPNLFNCNNKLEVCAVESYIEGESITVVSCYRPPNFPNISTQEWETFFTQFRGKALFGGDFNSHNTLWGSSHTSINGNNL